MLPVDAKRLDCCRSGADEIPHRFVTFRNPNRRQLAGTQQPSQRKSIPAIRLHPIAGLPWDQRRGDHRSD
jgi:hypothetical protein